MGSVIMIVGFLLVSSAIWAFGLYQETKRDEAWLRLVDEHEGELVETGAGWFSSESARALELRVEGVSLRMDSFSVVEGGGRSRRRVHYQRVRAMVGGLSGRTAAIYKETALFSSLGKALGGQDVIVGDAAFDDAFIIKSSDPTWMKRALGGPQAAQARRVHLAALAERVQLDAAGFLTCTRRSRGGDLATCRAQLDLAMSYVRAFSPQPALGHTPARLEEGALPPGPPPGDAW